jgi:hypothetical protein
VGNDGVNRWDILGLLADAKNINDGEPCSTNCKTCEFKGRLSIQNVSVSGYRVKASASGITGKSIYITGKESCGDNCCAASWFWYDCYGKQDVEIGLAQYDITRTPIQAPDDGPSVGGVRALAVTVRYIKGCKCVEGTWRCVKKRHVTNTLMYEVVDLKDVTKGWKYSPPQP